MEEEDTSTAVLSNDGIKKAVETIHEENRDDEAKIQALIGLIRKNSKSFYVKKRKRVYRPMPGYSYGRTEQMRNLSLYLLKMYPDYVTEKGRLMAKKYGIEIVDTVKLRSPCNI